MVITKNYKICKSCIMDTTDPNIKFNANGVCDYCINFKDAILPSWNYGIGKEEEFELIARKIRQSGRNKKFDCLLGLSGGLDSSYMAHIAVKKYKLRPLLFHVDAGWNNNLAVSNIEKIVKGLQLPLFTEVINWSEMKELQRAFFKAQIPDQDLPQDIVFISTLYKYARKFKIKYILNGSNFSTECCREPEEWGGYLGVDRLLVKDIVKKHGKVDLKKLPVIDIIFYKIIYKYLFGIKTVNPLNYVPYLKEKAEKILSERYSFQKFQHKHHESRFTRFFEDYWLKEKFGFDKRRAHFSSLIMTKQLSKKHALERIKKNEMTPELLKKEFAFIAKKLAFSESELESLFNAKNQTFKNYKNKRSFIRLGAYFLQKFGSEKRYFR